MLFLGLSGQCTLTSCVHELRRTFLSSSTSSALKISHPLLSTIASLASKLMRRSSRMLSIWEERLTSAPTDLRDSWVTRLGTRGARGDEGPAIGDCGIELCLDG